MTLQSSHRDVTATEEFPPAIISGWTYIPYQAFGTAENLRLERDRLTFVPKFADEGTDPIRVYRDVPNRRYLGVPRAYAQARFPWLPFQDRRTMGEPILSAAPRLPDPNHPAVSEPERQEQFMRDMLDGARNYGNFTAEAATGSGKTVVALWLSQQLARKTLVLVPLERLMYQWVDEIKRHLGLPEDRIGLVQGPTCQFQGRDIVVGMMHSLSQRQSYPREFYNSFGTVIFDEAHRTGSAMLSQCVPLFPAYHRIALSATPDRKDGGDRVGYWHIGPVRVKSTARALPCTVYVQKYHTQRPLYGKHAATRVKCLTQDWDRNRLLVDLIKRNYVLGRSILVIGAMVDHLQDLMEACARAGIPSGEMGQFTGQYHQRQTVQTPSGPRRRTVRKQKITKGEYERIKRESRIIFATYGVFKEGIDVPRLDCGIDVTPQSQATQVIGRIRRPLPGKPHPYWITLLDMACSHSRGMFFKRRQDYEKTGCRIVEIPERG